MPRTIVNALSIDDALHRFLVEDALPGTGVSPAQFFAGLAGLVRDFAPRNRALLAVRDTMQQQIDDWHRAHKGQHDAAAYRQFLGAIGYLLPEPADFVISTSHVDPEIATLAGPQLVVPVMNARFALNAANARWGSLYDALYGTDAIAGQPEGAPGGYDKRRGAKVIAWARDFLDRSVPLAGVSWSAIAGLTVQSGALLANDGANAFALSDGRQFVGFQGPAATPTSILLRHNGLHIEIVLDSATGIGQSDRAGIADVRLEAAVTTIMDCEDSVAAVDAADKVLVYRNWLGLMDGKLEETIVKSGRMLARRLMADRVFEGADGSQLPVKARSLMLVRNVGHLMTTDAVLDEAGQQIPEGILDALVTAMIGMHDVGPAGRRANSAAGSIYVVKPKMHGPDEVAFACEIFTRVETVLGLAPNTVKIGIMDEERRTTVNLKAAIHAARQRVVFINTGFLDRTGDEIHTSMEAGPMVRKGDMKKAAWIAAYESRNVEIGLACGLAGRGQIGKGMWAMPDLMAAMLEQKLAHPQSGASTAWVPSPTAAVLHATHYHAVNVQEVQRRLRNRPPTALADILTIPVVQDPGWTAAEIQRELDNNAQGILGYMVRWIDQGIGCSKVPDIDNVALMEDRATLRISAQHMANWLHHGVASRQQVVDTMERMAVTVDRQNAGDPAYRPMAADFSGSVAFQAALELVLDGRRQPSGYTEPVLHRRRLEVKAGR